VTIETLLGQEVSRSYLVVTAGQRQDIRCQTVAALWNASDNLVTVTKYFTTGANANRVQSVKNPDGTMTIYDYIVSADGSYQTNVVSAGQPDGTGASIVDGTKTATVIGSVGQLISRTTIDVASGITNGSETYGNYDEFQRPRHVVYLDGASEDVN